MYALYHVVEACRKINACTYLCPFDDDRVGGKVDTPGQSCRGDEDLDVLVVEEFFHKGTVHSTHTSIVDRKAIG